MSVLSWLFVIFIFLFLYNFVRHFGCVDVLTYTENGKTFRYEIVSKVGFLNFFLKGRSRSFYNKRSGNGYLFTSIYQVVVSLIILHYLVLGAKIWLKELQISSSAIEVSPIYLATFLIIMFASFFWNERKDYYFKWQYLAESYKSFRFEEKDNLRKLKFVDFMHDIQLMSMWSHQSYADIVGKFLFKSGALNKEKVINKVSEDEFEELIANFWEKIADKNEVY